jgi:predicted MFS family arabinose efflux permease
MGGFASAVFLPLAHLLNATFGWRGALVVLAGFVAATAVPHAVLLRRPPPGAHARPDRPPASWGSVRRTLLERRVFLLTGASVVTAFATTATAVHLVALLIERDYPPAVAATAAGAVGALSVAGRVAVTGAAARLGLARVGATMVAAWIPAVVALQVLPAGPGLVLFVLVFGAGFGVMTIVRASLLAEYVDPQLYGRVAGVQAGLLNVARVAAPVAAAWSRSSSGSFSVMLWMLCTCAGLAGAALLGCHRGHAADSAH